MSKNVRIPLCGIITVSVLLCMYNLLGEQRPTDSMDVVSRLNIPSILGESNSSKLARLNSSSQIAQIRQYALWSVVVEKWRSVVTVVPSRSVAEYGEKIFVLTHKPELPNIVSTTLCNQHVHAPCGWFCCGVVA